jgi:hypothetical protein
MDADVHQAEVPSVSGTPDDVLMDTLEDESAHVKPPPPGALDFLNFRNDIRAVEIICSFMAYRSKHKMCWAALLDLFNFFQCLLVTRSSAFPSNWRNLKERLALYLSVSFRLVIICEECKEVRHTIDPLTTAMPKMT